MLGLKWFANPKWGYVIIFMALLVAGLWVYRHSFMIMRFMIGQETRIRTASFLQFNTSHYDIKYTEHDREDIEEIANTAEVAYDLVGAFFGSLPVEQITMVVYPDNASLAQSFGWERNEKAMGVYWGGTIRILSPQLYLIKPGEIKEAFLTKGPMVHELTHLWVDNMTRGNYTRWWTEGVAQYVEREATGFTFGNPFANGQEISFYILSDLEKDFDRLEQSVAYWESLKMIDYLIDHYGKASIFQIMSDLGEGKKMSQAIEEALGISYNIFQQQFYQELEGNGREV